MNVQLIFLHGGPGLPDYLEPYFAGRFGPSIELKFYTQLRGPGVHLADLLKQLADVLGPAPRPTILVGHSWGGVLALEFLRRHPRSMVAGLVLMDSFLSVGDVSDQAVYFTAEELPAAGTLLQDLMQNLDPAVFATLMAEVVQSFDARDVVRHLNIPILNIFGAEDVRTPAARLRTYPECNAGLVNVEVLNAGHFPFVGNAGNRRVVKALAEFTERVVSN